MLRARHSDLIGKGGECGVLEQALVRLEDAGALLEGRTGRDRIKYYCVKGRLLGEIFSHLSPDGVASSDHQAAATSAFNVALEEIGRSDKELACLKPKVPFLAQTQITHRPHVFITLVANH